MVNASLRAVINASRHSIFWIREIPVWIMRSISQVICAFLELKTSMSRCCVRCKECSGNKVSWMQFKIQWRITSAVVWLPCPLKMSNRVLLSALSWVFGSKSSINHFLPCALLVQPSLLQEKNQSFGIVLGIHRLDNVLPLKIIKGRIAALFIEIHSIAETHSCRPE